MDLRYEKKFGNYRLFDRSIPFMFHSPYDCPEIQSEVESLWGKVKGIFPEGSPTKIFYRGKEHLKTVLCNLFMAKLSGKCLAVSRDNNAYTRHGFMGKYHVKQKILLGILDYLTEQEFIGYAKGRKYGGKCYSSRYWALPKLYPVFARWKPEDMSPIKQSSQLVILKDAGEPPKVIRYRNTEEIRQRKEQLVLINENYCRHFFDVYLETDKSTNHLTRFFPRIVSIYNRGSWSLGGRLYNKSLRGLCYQQLSKEQRSRVLIDGERVIECDFASLHIHMLYARSGLQLDKDGYGFLSGEMRDVAKKFMLALLNAESERDALGSMYELRYQLLCSNAMLSEKEQHLLNQMQKVDFKQALAQARDYHRAIGEYFCSGVGLSLQNQDARIALELVHAFAVRRVPVLPVHDSFLAPLQRRDELREAMTLIYRKHNNGFDCPIV